MAKYTFCVKNIHLIHRENKNIKLGQNINLIFVNILDYSKTIKAKGYFYGLSNLKNTKH